MNKVFEKGLGSAEGAIYVFKGIINVLIHTKTKAELSSNTRNNQIIGFTA